MSKEKYLDLSNEYKFTHVKRAFDERRDFNRFFLEKI